MCVCVSVQLVSLRNENLKTFYVKISGTSRSKGSITRQDPVVAPKDSFIWFCLKIGTYTPIYGNFSRGNGDRPCKTINFWGTLCWDRPISSHISNLKILKARSSQDSENCCSRMLIWYCYYTYIVIYIYDIYSWIMLIPHYIDMDFSLRHHHAPQTKSTKSTVVTLVRQICWRNRHRSWFAASFWLPKRCQTRRTWHWGFAG